MQWYWLPEYTPRFAEGLWLTVQLLALSISFGMLLAIPIGLVQVTGPRPPAWLARAFCTAIRGTLLLIQLWLIYYGVGSLFPSIPGIRESFLWPILRDAFPYAVVAFSLSVAGYEGEVMRGAFRGVPKGELEAARAIGMTRFQVLRRIWLPGGGTRFGTSLPRRASCTSRATARFSTRRRSSPRHASPHPAVSRATG